MMTDCTIGKLIAELDRINRLYDQIEHCQSESEFERVADARLDAEDAVQEIDYETIDDPNLRYVVLKCQLAIFVRRSVGGIDVSSDLARIAGLALSGLGVMIPVSVD